MLSTFGLGASSHLSTFGLGDIDSTAEAVSLSFSLQQHVYKTNKYLPLIGSKAVEFEQTSFDIKGFHFDRKRWVDLEQPNNFNPGYIGNINLGFVDKTKYYQWKSGIGSDLDCDLTKLVFNRNNEEEKWSPYIYQGDYFSYLTPFYLFGDGHVTHPLITGFVNLDVTVDSVELEFTPSSTNPIVAAIYYREDDLSAFPWRRAELVESFTGNLVGNEREETIIDGVPDYSAVDSFLRYEIYHNVETNRLHFNQNFATTVGSLDITNGIVAETLGTSDGTGGQIFFSRYFPIDPGIRGSTREEKHRLFVSGIEWSVADDNNLAFHSSTDNVYFIDYDLGLIKFGGQDIDAILHLSGAIDSLETELPLYGDIDLLPEQGIVLIDSEKIKYLRKTETSLIQCTRGFAGTTAVSHSIHVSVDYVISGNIPAGSTTIEIAYQTTPRIEYGVQEWSEHVTADSVNVRPLVVSEGNGLVYISRVPLILDSLTLEVNKPLLSGTVYGPLSYGSDYALLTATALTASSEPIPQLSITIEQISDPPFVGLMNGTTEDYVSFSNGDGEVITSYTAGSDLASILIDVEDISIVSGQTEITLGGNYSSVSLTDIFIYVITKDDPMKGTVGLLSTYDSGSLDLVAPLAGANQTLGVTTLEAFPTVVIADIYPDNYFNNGTIEVYLTDTTMVSGTIKYWRSGTVHIQEILSITDGTIDYVILKHPNWIDWNASTLNGKRRILYEYSPNAINPLTNALGAYFPIQPSSLAYNSVTNQTTLLFDYVLATPSSTNVTNNVGGYTVTIPRQVSFRAKATDPFTNQILISNTLQVRVTLPDYLNGVYLTESGRIPYGFRIRDDSLNASAGLDGSTFVTLNPIAGSYGAVSNPFASVLHMINV